MCQRCRVEVDSFLLRGESVTRETSFPVLMAVTDSKHPVVEKVQQLPQSPCRATESTRSPKRKVILLLTAVYYNKEEVTHPDGKKGVFSIFINLRNASSIALQCCPLHSSVVVVPLSGYYCTRKLLVLGVGIFYMFQSNLILYRCHITPLISPVDGFREWAICFDVTAFCGRAVLQRRKCNVTKEK